MLGCGSSSESAAEEPIPDERPAGRISFRFDDGVPSNDRYLIQGVIEDARLYFAEETGRDLKLNADVIVTTRGAAIFHPAYTEFVPRSGLLEVTFYLGHESWPRTQSNRAVAVKSAAAAHEYFHMLQFSVISNGPRPNTGPSWILEGSAEYAAYRYADSRGLLEFDATRQAQASSTEERTLPRLGEFETTRENYVLGFLAMDRLAGSGGIRRLVEYFADTSRMDWKDAFSKNFGKDVDIFVKEFAASDN